jgi:hypothetical protein
LLVHPNNGITFDLTAIRGTNPDHRLARFLAVVGNTETSAQYGDARTVWADVWVLVDGKIRFRRREINGFTGGLRIAIPLTDQDRFLTLIATDGGNGLWWDWIIFGDPRLELVPLTSPVGAVPRATP